MDFGEKRIGVFSPPLVDDVPPERPIQQGDRNFCMRALAPLRCAALVAGTVTQTQPAGCLGHVILAQSWRYAVGTTVLTFDNLYLLSSPAFI